MANTIKFKRASGSDPSASDLAIGEPGLRTDTAELFFKKDDGTVAKVSGGGGGPNFKYLELRNAANNGAASFPGNDFTLVTAGTTTAITPVAANTLLVSVSGVIQKPNSGTSTSGISGFIVDGSRFKTATNLPAAPDFIVYQESGGIGEPSDNTVTSAKIVDGAIVNADINASAAIAGTKISPNFGSQAIATTGNISGAQGSFTGDVDIASNLVHTGDTDTKISFITNTIKFDTDSSERLRINSDGNVGIGTTSPNYLLDVQAASGDASLRLRSAGTGSGDDTIFRMQVVGTTQDNFIYFGDSGDSNIGQIRYNHNSDFMSMHTNTSERMRINSSGDVGIGTTSPNRHLHLHQSDSTGAAVRFTNTTTGSGENDGLTVGINGSEQAEFWQRENTAMVFGTNNAERMRIDSSGYVGIGTSSPTINVHVQSSGTNSLLKLAGTSAGSGINDGLDVGINGVDGILWNRENGPIQFATNNSERMRLTASGNLNIASSSSRLSQTTFKSQIETGTNKLISFGETQGSAFSDQGAALVFSRPSDGASEICGIFQHTNESLGIGARENFTISTGGNAFYYSTTERMRIDSSGNVGIGQTNPAAFDKFVVQGTGNVISAQASSGSVGIGLFEGNTGRFFLKSLNGSDGIAFVDADNSSERMRIDSSGNVGVGISSPASTLHTSSSGDHVVTHQTTTSGADVRMNFRDSGNTDRGGIHYLFNGNSMKFITATSERMRITSAGHVFIANTSFSSGSKVKQFEVNPNAIATKSSASSTGLQFHNEFHNSNGMVGSISTSGSGTSFNESSDYRLKENVTAISDGITRLKTLKPSRFNFKADKDTTVDGFLAHEVTLAVPEAITGTKDEVDSDNNPIYQGIDKSKLVPLLVAALQEAIGRIEALEAK